MPLNNTQIRQIRALPKPRKLSDGGGLFLLVQPTGSRLWRLSYRFSGKQKTMALGAYPEVSLAEARERRDAAKKLLANGADPMEQVKAEKAQARAMTANTFGTIADDLLAKLEKEERAETTLTKIRWLLDFARPDLKDRPIGEISSAEVLGVLRKVEARGRYETARRLRSTIGQVFRFAIATARAENDPTFALKGALIAPKVTHRAAITDWQRFAGLMSAIEGYDGAPETRCALTLLALLYPRPGELRMARWDEFDLTKNVWTIPTERAKMRREHRKPLSWQAVAVLEQTRLYVRQSALVLPSVRCKDRPMSENTLNAALRRLGYTKDEMTAHGFRATASTLLNESGKWNPDAIEAELGHADEDEIRRAYHRAHYWDERERMAQWWADEIQALIS